MKRMTMRSIVVVAVALLSAAGPAVAGERDRSAVVVTSSNAINNELLVYDTAGALVQSIATLGQGGASANAGGIATSKGLVAVVNFGSETVSIFSRGASGFELRQLVAVASRPVSVTFGTDHLYVLGTSTVESHRLDGDRVDDAADGIVPLIAADGSAAQVGLVGQQLIVTEKSGTIEYIELRGGAVFGSATPVTLPSGSGDTPFGLVTRGSNAYVTIAGSDLVGVVNNGVLTAAAATGIPGGSGQHSPCWVALVGPYLFTTNSPSHSISRLVAGGRNITLDEAVAAETVGSPIDIAAEGTLLAIVETDGEDLSHLTLFRIDDDGNLTRTAGAPIASSANGVAIISQN